MSKPRSGGPKTIYGTKASTQINIRVTPGQFQLVKSKVKSLPNDESVNAYVRTLILNDLRKDDNDKT